MKSLHFFENHPHANLHPESLCNGKIIVVNQLITSWNWVRIGHLKNKIHKEVILQENLVKGALYGHGDFELNNVVCHMQCEKIIWQNKSQKEKDTLLQKFLLFGLKKKPESSSVTSTDGKLTIPNTGAWAKKPGQKKWVKNAKTFSCIKNRLE